MNRFIITSLRFLFIVMLVSAAPLAAEAFGVDLIPNSESLSSNSPSKNGSFGEYWRLTHSDSSKPWCTEHDSKELKYIQIDFGSTISLDKNTEDIVVYLKRHNAAYDLEEGEPTAPDTNAKKYHPTLFRVEISEDGKNWVAFRGNHTHLHFLFRGIMTDEFSERITTDKTFRYMRLYLLGTTDKRYINESFPNGYPSMDVGQLKILRVGRNDALDENWVDRFTHTGDIIEGYSNFGFEHTQGVLQERTFNGKTIHNQDGIGPDYCDWSNWSPEGHWTPEPEDMARISASGISMPDLSFITPAESDYVIAGNRQNTNVAETEVFAMPGDVIQLYPYYGLYDTNAYREDYIHWYDYAGGGRLRDGRGNDLLSMMTEPRDIIRTEAGFFGGWGFFKPDKNGDGTYNFNVDHTLFDRQPPTRAAFYMPVDPYAPADSMYSYMEFPGNYRVDEYTVAADMSMTFHTDYHLNIEKGKETIYEPRVHVRRVFHIKDGRTQAEEFSGSAKAHEKYIKKHYRTISARANEDFQVRLEYPVPKDNREGMLYHKTDYGTYERIGSVRLKVYDMDNNQEVSGTTFELKEKEGFTFDSKSKRVFNESITNVPYYTGFTDGTSDTKFHLLLSCSAANARTGRYLVKLLALGTDGMPLHPYGAPDKELVMQEYEIRFLPIQRALMATEAEVAEKYPYAIETNIEADFGAPKSVINYDGYAKLYDVENGSYKTNDYLCVENQENGAAYYKWALSWSESTYAFGHNFRGDYNMYMVASHSDVCPFKDLAKKRPADKNFGKSMGLYDRKFYQTQGESQGFFYYVNAATDPGLLGRMQINQLCPGSTIHVSAWVAEMNTYPERANLCFNFIGVLPNKERKFLDAFVTGYVPERTDYAEWQHVYFSIVPNFSASGLAASDFDHFEIELENNCVSSWGADYAIDDIRIYVARPTVYARQTRPLCSDEKKADVKIETPFDILLQTVGEVPAQSEKEGKDVDIYYTFLDTQKYYSLADTDTETAFYKARLHNCYGRVEDGNTETCGKMTFNTYYNSSKNLRYADFPDKVGVAMTQDIDGVRYITFNTTPADEYSLKPGTQYSVLLYACPSGEIVEAPSYKEFDPSGRCANLCRFIVQGSGVIKVDGIVVTDLGNITACENQQPVVQVDLLGIKGNTGSGTMETVQEDAYLDWYYGSVKEYYSEKMGDSTDALSLAEVIEYFRNEYPESATLFVEPKGAFTKEMRDYLVTLVTPIDDNAPKLTLHTSSFIFPPLPKPAGGDEFVRVVAIPHDMNLPDMTVCTAPTEVDIRVLRKAPGMFHGVNIEYPEYISDVPLRVGLGQLNRVSADKSNMSGHTVMLKIPIRSLSFTSASISSMQKGKDEGVYLAATNDPEYRTLHNSSDAGEITGLMEVGCLRDISARNEVTLPEGADYNFAGIVFDKSFRFKEGYYYSFIFGYSESLKGADLADDELPCDGRRSFTIKVVPEYAKWTGAADNLNWNNDYNWSRVTSTELYRTVKDEYTSDGSNGNTFAYAPLDFTKVVIPTGGTFPYLYSPKKSISVKSCGNTYTWPEDPVDADEASPASKPQNGLDLLKGGFSYDMQYDMVAENGKDFIGCRPWYTHTCDQIHFSPETRIFHQQYLTYNRAWVDMETTPDRWYTLSSPLRGTVAGDMYLPSASGRQHTELFKPIIFNTENNNRFAPAVYQRSWNKASAKVFEIKDLGTSRNVAVAADWSNVFNDVTENYSEGNGFSIKTDVSAMTGTPPASVLFRLPKDDSEYLYYDELGTISGDTTSIQRPAGYGKLNDINGTITVSAYAPSKYFLVGNPFMCDMDMQRFLTGNSDIINAKYWILTSDGQGAAIMDETTEGFVGTISNSSIVPPMQGFFVEAKEKSSSITLKYDKSMMHYQASDYGMLKAPRSRAASEPETELPYNVIRISAVTESGVVSSALIRVNPQANAGYAAQEDALLYFDPESAPETMVYTLAGGNATAINTVPELEGVEIGALTDRDVTLRIDNCSAALSYLIFNPATEEYIPVEEGMEISLPASASRHLVLTKAGKEMAPGGSISIVAYGQEVKVSTAENRLVVNVCDINGNIVFSIDRECNEVTFTLPWGIYIIQASDGRENTVRKILIQ